MIVESLLEQGMLAAFSTRKGGVSAGGFASLNVDLRQDDNPACVEENRRQLKAVLEIEKESGLITITQPHGSRIVSIGELLDSQDEAEADGVFIEKHGHPVMLMFADCVPLILADIDKRHLVSIHAGWKGTAGGIAGYALARLLENGSRIGDIRAYFGPAIRGCCYEVHEETGHELGLNGSFPQQTDLIKLNSFQLTQAGINNEHIHDCRLCTACDDERFFSYRRDGKNTGRQASVAAII